MNARGGTGIVFGLCLAACTSSSEKPCVPPTGPSEAACEAYTCGPELATGWLSDQVAAGSCATTPSSDPSQFYATCTGIPSSPYECAGLASGQHVCSGRVSTALCADDDACPAGSRCYPAGYPNGLGICEKTCSTPGNAECGRCDRACDTASGLCIAQGPGYPTNLPCDSSHPGIAVTFDVSRPYNWATLNIALPGASTTVLSLLPNAPSITLRYPTGATAGDATLTFLGSGGGLIGLSGTVTFAADPTICTMVTLHVIAFSGIPDAGAGG